MPQKLTASIEVTGLLAIVATASTFAAIGFLTEVGCIWLTLVLLATILGLSWYQFDGGRHPCFLFMVMLFVFQGGRLVGYVVGLKQDPMLIEVQTRLPIAVEPKFAEITLLIIVLSAILVYFPCRYCYKPAAFRRPLDNRWLPSLYALVFMTVPFSLYKNLMYYSYIRAHGGYLAIYTDNAAVLQSAGVVARTLSLVNVTAILVLFVVENRSKRMVAVLWLFVALSVLDLLIGFRGKFFSEMISLWFLVNLKTGRRFKLPYLISIASVISLIAVAIGFFRENQTFKMVSPLGFLVVQGVSLNVTEAAVKFHSTFSRFGWEYLWGGFLNGFTPSAAHGLRLWSGDLSVFLNPVASDLGFGTASSYLGELYLFGEIPSIVIGSLAIGYCLHLLHRVSSRTAGALLLAFILPPVIYLPRLELLNPLAVLVKSCIGLGVIAVFVLFFDFILRVLWIKASPRRAGII